MPSATLPVGTPLWKKPTVKGETSAHLNIDTLVIHPESTTDATHTIFEGVTCMDGEPVSSLISIRKFGQALARVMGPVAAGDSVGFAAGETHLVKDGTPFAAACVDSIGTADVKLILVNIGQVATAGGLFYTLVAREGRDALLCSTDYWNGGETIIVMKPSDLRVSVKTAFPLKFGRNQIVTLDEVAMDALVFWGARGMIVKVVDQGIVNEEFAGANSGKQHQVTWPMYCSKASELVDDRANIVIDAHEPNAVGIMVAKSSNAVGRVDPVTLKIVDSGGVEVYHIDMNVEKRSWKTLSEILMTQRTKQIVDIDGTPSEFAGFVYNE